ncbi:hypothetical protein [Tahibacter amnicola]|uniref:DUF1579 domain-containing protein n=1 Tax=Tahibacter amnicola TaxID=2976241 RepID=A0ABY6B9X0_9GAMM|nr:hypothetical protein [Tahibacter amnicola]UXI66858.1 hypothetical protein N4264_19170 [Tahibacter amnicola]
MKTLALLLCAVLILPMPTLAQQVDAVTPAPAAARQFDFLIGQWDVEVTPKVGGLAAMIHGTPRLVGTWKAWRALDGLGVQDELRIVDSAGNPRNLTHTLRLYSVAQSQWTLTGVEAYRGRSFDATAVWAQDAMTVAGTGVDGEGKAYQSRTRFFGIGTDHFNVQQDRSYDNGASWDEAALTMEARRVSTTASR